MGLRGRQDIVEIFILSISVAALTLCDYLYIRRAAVVTTNKKIHIKGLLPQGWRQIVCFCLIPASLTAVMLMLRLFYQADIVFVLKRICLVAILWPIAISDYREFRIPNKLVLCGIICRLLILVLELLLERELILEQLINEGVAAVSAVIICLACMVLSRGSLGMGDLKLMFMMGLLLGVEGILYSMFVSIFFSFVVAVILLLTRKKGRKDSIPFAPFILTGTIVSLILSGV